MLSKYFAKLVNERMDEQNKNTSQCKKGQLPGGKKWPLLFRCQACGSSTHLTTTDLPLVTLNFICKWKLYTLSLNHRCKIILDKLILRFTFL